MLKSFIVTPAAGKRLIGMGIVKHHEVQRVLKKGTLVIVAGTTNGYVAEEIVKAIGGEAFSRAGFCRGATIAPGAKKEKVEFSGDLVVTDGKVRTGREIFDVVDELKAGDVIIKGANAVNLSARQAAVLVGHPMCGTAGAAIPAVVGRRVKMIVPVGVEKRVEDDLSLLAEELNAADADGPRLLPLPGEVFTELDAVRLLTGARATIAAAGGTNGAEGCVWLAVSGTGDQLAAAETLLRSVAQEPSCRV